jgi:hypothetical protein
MEVQTILFDREKWSRRDAQGWARAHGYRMAIDATRDRYRMRQAQPAGFTRGSFRTIDFGNGIQAVVGCPKARNPGTVHKVPKQTVYLGRPIDLWVRHQNRITHYTAKDLAGFQMLTTPNAEELAPGRARLFLVKPKKINAGGKIYGPGARTFRTWHKRDPDTSLELDGIADAIGTQRGRADTLDYSSAKWLPPGSRPQDYTHSFLEGRPPLVYVDRLQRPTAFVLTGGDMRITRHGIE